MFNEILNLCTRVVIAVEKLADAAQKVTNPAGYANEETATVAEVAAGIARAAKALDVTPPKEAQTENPTFPTASKAKRTRNATNAPGPQTANPSGVQSAATNTPAPAGATSAEPAQTAELPTRDEIRALLAQVMTKKGKEVAGKIITEIGNSTNITKIVDENLQAVFDACQKELA